MAFTRYHDDLVRMEKQVIESSFAGMYHLTTPGNSAPAYVDDVHVRLQKWGANLQTNSFAVNDALRGATKKLSRDATISTLPSTSTKSYATKNFGVDETRASCPAWTFRDLPQAQYQHLFYNPQAHVSYLFENNTPTRMLEKDYYRSPYY
jgi:hypothetical protein